ncbi:hypothetical protein [Mucilaginibacter sp. OK268]|uniref:hypothetical protein n=1 Tax=Mucilaginibacter sp. OK268 TaxID=1881048 RepID=UPI000B85FFD9|nr:hypothetical protein [Mucilaginibacter sp. OK268]
MIYYLAIKLDTPEHFTSKSFGGNYICTLHEPPPDVKYALSIHNKINKDYKSSLSRWIYFYQERNEKPLPSSNMK